MDAIRVKNLCKGYSDFKLDNISFQLPKGYIMGYVGQNGAGKSTTLKAITHITKADKGDVMINGITYKQDPILFKEQIGFIGDESYFPYEFNLLQVKSILKDFYPSFREEEFMKYVDRWKLPYKKTILKYSQGMKVRLMFAAVLARDTKLLILDEATNGLDPVIKEEVLELIQGYIEDGERSVIFSTHILSDLEQIADYIFFIDDGKKVFFDLKDDLIERYVVVKGGLEDLNSETEKHLIGVKASRVGFTAVMRSDESVMLDKRFIVEKPSIDQLVTHFIKQKGGK